MLVAGKVQVGQEITLEQAVKELQNGSRPKISCVGCCFNLTPNTPKSVLCHRGDVVTIEEPRYFCVYRREGSLGSGGTG